MSERFEGVAGVAAVPLVAGVAGVAALPDCASAIPLPRNVAQTSAPKIDRIVVFIKSFLSSIVQLLLSYCLTLELTLCSQYGIDIYEKDNSLIDAPSRAPYHFKMSKLFIVLIVAILTIACQSAMVFAAGTTATGSNTTAGQATNAQLLEDFLPGSPAGTNNSQSQPANENPKPRKNSPDSVNFNYSRDNDQDTNAHLGGDVYFGANTHFGIYGESSTESSQSTGTNPMTSKTFAASLGTDWHQPFSLGVSFTYFGIKGDLTEDTIKLPLTYDPNRHWSFTLKPGQGAIDFDVTNSTTGNTSIMQVGDQSIGGGITYTVSNWQFYAYAEVHSFSHKIKGIGGGCTNRKNCKIIITPSSTIRNLADQIITNAQSASVMYYFRRFDLGVEFDKSQSALDNSISDTWTINNDIYWTKRLTLSPSFAATSTAGTNLSTGQPYPDIYTGTVGMSYTFD